jgi:hypothetical protein
MWYYVTQRTSAGFAFSYFGNFLCFQDKNYEIVVGFKLVEFISGLKLISRDGLIRLCVFWSCIKD